MSIYNAFPKYWHWDHHSLIDNLKGILNFPKNMITQNFEPLYIQLTTGRLSGSFELTTVFLSIAYISIEEKPMEVFFEQSTLEKSDKLDLNEEAMLLFERIEEQYNDKNNYCGMLYNTVGMSENYHGAQKLFKTHFWINWDKVMDIRKTVDHNIHRIEPFIKNQEHLYFNYNTILNSIDVNLPIFEFDPDYFKKLPLDIQELYFKEITDEEKHINFLQKLHAKRRIAFDNPEVRLLYETSFNE